MWCEGWCVSLYGEPCDVMLCGVMCGLMCSVMSCVICHVMCGVIDTVMLAGKYNFTHG